MASSWPIRKRGAAPIVLIHGIACDHTTMARQFEHYRGSHRVVSVDLRGHGQSDKPQGDYTLDQYVEDTVSTRERASGQSAA